MNLLERKQLAEKIIERRCENVFPSKEEAIKRLANEDGLRVYLGIDPTGTDIHIGHSIPLLFLHDLWRLGHKPILLIGDFTARIGDPTDKESARQPLTEDQIKENMKDYLEQVRKILPEGSFELEYNSSWLGKLSFAQILELASEVTVGQMLARDMFRERMKQEKPIGVHEFLYPLMQGYDSVAMKVDGEVGGNDQTFNMLVGRDLVKKHLNKDKLVFAMRLLVAETGKKMSKTEGKLISLNDTSDDIFGKTMASIPDDMIAETFRLATNKDEIWIEAETQKIKDGANPINFKKALAQELTRMYCGDKEAHKAADNWIKVFSKKELPTEITEAWGDEMMLIDFMREHSLASSASKAKSLVEQGAVSINNEVIKDWYRKLKAGDIVKIGPKKFLKVASN